jgi:hypothetical protein
VSIGKTDLVSAFVSSLDAGERVLLSTCDDLSVPRPFGPFHDMAVAVSPDLPQALRSGIEPQVVHGLLLGEVAAAPAPLLVVEDVHWADEATLDALPAPGSPHP